MMINDDFMLKALFILKIFKFCLDLFGHEGKRLDKKYKITQTGKQIITIHHTA